jgi:hypothetical protein
VSVSAASKSLALGCPTASAWALKTDLGRHKQRDTVYVLRVLPQSLTCQLISP